MTRIKVGKVRGDSAYEIAQKHGFGGSEKDWLDDLKKAEPGKNATINGVNTLKIEEGENIEIEQLEDTLTISSKSAVESVNGRKGVVELKASDIAFDDGDTFQSKLESGELRGQDGKEGPPGEPGLAGEQGERGRDGESAFEIANKYKKFDSEQEWLESLVVKSKEVIKDEKTTSDTTWSSEKIIREMFERTTIWVDGYNDNISLNGARKKGYVEVTEIVGTKNNIGTPRGDREFVINLDLKNSSESVATKEIIIPQKLNNRDVIKWNEEESKFQLHAVSTVNLFNKKDSFKEGVPGLPIVPGYETKYDPVRDCIICGGVAGSQYGSPHTIDVEPHTQYTLSFYCDGNYVQCWVKGENRVDIFESQTTPGGTAIRTFNSGANRKIYLLLGKVYSYQGETIVRYLQLEKGPVATPYQEFDKIAGVFDTNIKEKLYIKYDKPVTALTTSNDIKPHIRCKYPTNIQGINYRYNQLEEENYNLREELEDVKALVGNLYRTLNIMNTIEE